jgi:hypothetical protein
MKKRILFFLVAAVAAIGFAACKKEKAAEPATPFSDLFKNTEWTGEMKYDNIPVAEPFSIKFDASANFQWYERSGDYGGIYKLNANTRELALTFWSGSKFTTTITADNKFSNIILAGAYPWKINSAEYNKSGNQALDNTIWENAGAAQRIIFKPGQKVQVNTLPEQPYGRAGCAIKAFTTANKTYFTVLQPAANTLKGIEVHKTTVGGSTLFFYNSFECTKQ